MSYGYCPYCQSEVTGRTRGGANGNDTCRQGHVYPSRMTLASPKPTGGELLREAGQLLAAAEEVVADLKGSHALMQTAIGTRAFSLLRELLNGPFLHQVRATRQQIDAHLDAVARGAAA